MSTASIGGGPLPGPDEKAELPKSGAPDATKGAEDALTLPPSGIPPDVVWALSVLDRIRQGETLSADELRRVESVLTNQAEALGSATRLVRLLMHRNQSGNC